MDFNFEKLDVYQKAKEFVYSTYTITRHFPKNEIFGLTNQLRRASISIMLNIAEGTSRSDRDFIRFIDMARGSAFECFAILEVSLEQNYVNIDKYNILKKELKDISKMLSGLKNSLNVKIINKGQ